MVRSARGVRAQIDAAVEAAEAAAVWWPIKDLVEWSANPNEHPDDEIDDLVKSIRRFGFGAPLIARKASKMILAGHGRYKAARRLGLTHVRVVFLDLTEEEAQAYALADNKIGRKSSNDKDREAAILADLKRKEVELVEGTGYDTTEVVEALKRAEELLGGVPDDEPGDGDHLSEPRDSHDQPVLGLHIPFDDELQKDAYEQFLAKLKTLYPDEGTVGRRLMRHISKDFPSLTAGIIEDYADDD